MRPKELTPDYLRTFNRLFGQASARNSRQERFDRTQLPTPSVYYAEALGVEFGNRSGWVSVRCPLHDDNAPSLSVNLQHGGYKCHACGAAGGDVLAFHRRRHEMSFETAARDLGAWND